MYTPTMERETYFQTEEGGASKERDQNRMEGRDVLENKDPAGGETINREGSRQADEGSRVRYLHPACKGPRAHYFGDGFFGRQQVSPLCLQVKNPAELFAFSTSTPLKRRSEGEQNTCWTSSDPSLI